MRIAGFGTYDAEAHPRVAVLLDGLRAHGVQVIEVNDPLPLRTAERVAILQQPWRIPVLAAALARCWGRLIRRSLRMRGAARPDMVLVGYLGHFDVLLARLRWPRTPIVLDHLVSAAGTAHDRGETGGVKQAVLRALDRHALGRADVVVVDTDESLANLPGPARSKAVVVPVGAGQAWFEAGDAAATRPRADREPLSVVFFGLFTPLQGAVTIAEALALLPPGTVHARLIGTGQDHARARAVLSGRTDITWHDWVPGTDLPALVAAAEVCLGIFGTTAKAHTVVPTKVYQGAAAGCAVLTSDTAPQRRAFDGAALLVPPGDPGALAAALADLAGDPAAVARWRAASAQRARAAFDPASAVGALVEVLPQYARVR